MAQIKFTADLASAQFPMISDWAPRTVMQAQLDEDKQGLVTAPQILYCQDVMPTTHGYKSVSYRDLITAALPANTTFSKYFLASDAAQNKAWVGVTSDSKIWMITSSSYIWVDVTPAGWAGGDAVTCASASGLNYLYLKQKGCYLVNVGAVSLTLTALAGITAANIYGIFSSVNYLCLWDATTVYHSSTSNPLDFVPSLITGAGSEVPNDIEGVIVTIVQLNNGFAIYTTLNIILASYSNNTQFPFIYRNANNCAGIANSKQVSATRDLGFHVAFTYAGILKITPQGCTPVAPEATDLITSRLYETYDFATDTITQTALDTDMVTQINIIASRYIVLSYGVSAATGFTDALVYDFVLQRYGKLHVAHACAFEIETNVDIPPLPYNQASEIGQTYAAASPQTYNSTAASFNIAPAAGQVFGFLLSTGAVKLAFLDYDYDIETDTGKPVLILGKYQAVRNQLLQLDTVEVESIHAANTSFALKVLSSINGKDWLPATVPTTTLTGAGIRRYQMRRMGKNHSLVFLNTFTLTTVEITAVIDAHR